jgi:uncharacterized Zn-binding protein involved in type VI secretion
MNIDAVPAARMDDLIAHNASQAARVIGELVNGMIVAPIAGAIKVSLLMAGPPGWLGLGLAFFVEWRINQVVDQVADSIGAAMAADGEPGIEMGSDNVSINRRPAARGGPEGDPLVCHPDKRVLAGTEWVAINTKPAARFDDWAEKSAKIATGSENVFVGGPQIEVDRKSDAQKFLALMFDFAQWQEALEGDEVAEMILEGSETFAKEILDTDWDFIRNE